LFSASSSLSRASVLGLLLLACAPWAAAQAPLQSVPELDLARYSGTWHEIARLPMKEQEQCVADVTATYTPQPDGNIEVRNSCRNAEGATEEAVGEARRVEGHPGRLEVRFAPGWLGWLPNVWGDYWVIALDPGYQWAVVGEPERRHLWLLARTARVSAELFDRMREAAQRQGYALDRLKSSGDTVAGATGSTLKDG